MAVLSKLTTAVFNAYILSWDAVLALLNLLTPSRHPGHVIPPGHPGFDGHWPPYVPPTDGDSRCSCPALNAMANHGILPHSGRGIPFAELTRTVRATYNFAPSFCSFVPHFCADFLAKNYATGTIDLHDLDLHNIGIEHDASLTREDAALVPDQGMPSPALVEALLASATGKSPDGAPLLTPADLSRYSARRRVDARRSNPHYSLDLGHKLFGSSNSSTMLTLFGGRVVDLRPWLLDERIPDNWEPRVRSRFGLTMAAFNATVLRVARGIDEAKVLAEDEAESGSK